LYNRKKLIRVSIVVIIVYAIFILIAVLLGMDPLLAVALILIVGGFSIVWIALMDRTQESREMGFSHLKWPTTLSYVGTKRILTITIGGIEKHVLRLELDVGRGEFKATLDDLQIIHEMNKTIVKIKEINIGIGRDEVHQAKVTIHKSLLIFLSVKIIIDDDFLFVLH
jgi:hypothetical protein